MLLLQLKLLVKNSDLFDNIVKYIDYRKHDTPKCYYLQLKMLVRNCEFILLLFPLKYL